ncbi:hypothetical protein C8D87_104183 [Lentzea atacamensis]|uniref:Uncharacterized protein n=1 Tax=Lentzea atacamensis TaxID=531938 RepID=A0ABX9EA78_9PSEU|nr:hypothetical protein C8D87_104183 [Lentzea atacamensis]
MRNGKTGEPLMSFREGVWRGPAMTEEQKVAKYGGKA